MQVSLPLPSVWQNVLNLASCAKWLALGLGSRMVPVKKILPLPSKVLLKTPPFLVWMQVSRPEPSLPQQGLIFIKTAEYLHQKSYQMMIQLADISRTAPLIHQPRFRKKTRLRNFFVRLFSFNAKPSSKSGLLLDRCVLSAQERALLERDSRQRIRVWLPFELRTLLWEGLITLLLLYYMMICIVEIAFGLAIYNEIRSEVVIFVIDDLSLVVFSLDILVQLNTAFFHEGELITERRLIEQHYVKRKLPIDALSVLVIGLELVNENYWTSIPKLLILLKLGRLFTFNEKVSQLLAARPKGFAVFKFLRVCVTFYLYSHIMACGYFMLDFYFYINPEKYPYKANLMLWLINSACLPGVNMITQYHWVVWYLYSMYWAIQTATTVGYGDITPRNPPEVLYVTINMILMCIMFGYFLNAVWEVLRELNQAEQAKQSHLRKLKNYMLAKEVPSHLQERVIKYVDNLYLAKQESEALKSLLPLVPVSMREELLLQMNSSFFNSPLFQLLPNYPKEVESLKRSVCALLEERLHSEYETIQTPAFMESLIYISKGEVECLYGKEVAFTKSSKFVCLTESVLESYNCYLVQTSRISTLIIVSFDKLKALLCRNSLFKYEFKRTVELARLGCSDALQQVCPLCGIPHEPRLCPHFHHIPDISAILQRNRLVRAKDQRSRAPQLLLLSDRQRSSQWARRMGRGQRLRRQALKWPLFQAVTEISEKRMQIVIR